MSNENRPKSEEQTNSIGDREAGDEWGSDTTSSFCSSDYSE